MRTDRILIQDILEAIQEVMDCTPTARGAFDADKFLRSHLLRNIQIIGEASTRLSKEIKEKNPQVPWREITGMRHAIVHDYFEIDWNEVYNTAVGDVPVLKSLFEVILVSFSSGGE